MWPMPPEKLTVSGPVCGTALFHRYFIISLFSKNVNIYEVHNNGTGTTSDSSWDHDDFRRRRGRGETEEKITV